MYTRFLLLLYSTFYARILFSLRVWSVKNYTVAQALVVVVMVMEASASNIENKVMYEIIFSLYQIDFTFAPVTHFFPYWILPKNTKIKLWHDIAFRLAVYFTIFFVFFLLIIFFITKQKSNHLFYVFHLLRLAWFSFLAHWQFFCVVVGDVTVVVRLCQWIIFTHKSFATPYKTYICYSYNLLKKPVFFAILLLFVFLRKRFERFETIEKTYIFLEDWK